MRRDCEHDERGDGDPMRRVGIVRSDHHLDDRAHGGADAEQEHALRPLHEPDVRESHAERFAASAHVRDEQRAGQREQARDEDPAFPVVPGETDDQRALDVAVENGIERGSRRRRATGAAGHAAVEKVERPGDDEQPAAEREPAGGNPDAGAEARWRTTGT